MPYIEQRNRTAYDEPLDRMLQTLEVRGFPAGEVTYLIYRVCLRWWTTKPCFATVASIRGCLLSVLAELDRVIFGEYEQKKLLENGDVDA